MNEPLHLTGEQFAECLTAEYLRPEVRAHLAACDGCREELRAFMASMEDFSQAALGWSRTRQAAPKLEINRLHRPVFARLEWALACVLAFAAGVPVALHIEQGNAAREHAAPSGSVQPDDSAAQIAQDNRLMQSVDLALAQTDPSPYQEYRLDDPERPAGARLRAE